MSYYDAKPDMVNQDSNYYYSRSYSDTAADLDHQQQNQQQQQRRGTSGSQQGSAAESAAAAVNNNSYPPPLQYRMPLPTVEDPSNPQSNTGAGSGGAVGHQNPALLPQPAYPPIYPQQHYAPDHGMSLPPPPPPPPTIIMPGGNSGMPGAAGTGGPTLPPAASLAGPNYSNSNMGNTPGSSGPPSHLMTTFNSKLSMRSLKKHACNVCGKRFTRPSSLQTHSYSHTGEKPFKCDYQGCGRHFSVVSNLRRHKKIHGPYTQ